MESLRVLVVDDEQELVDALVERLNMRGIKAEGVTTGNAALEYIGGSDCDVVLLDVCMEDDLPDSAPELGFDEDGKLHCILIFEGAIGRDIPLGGK